MCAGHFVRATSSRSVPSPPLLSKGKNRADKNRAGHCPTALTERQCSPHSGRTKVPPGRVVPAVVAVLYFCWFRCG